MQMQYQRYYEAKLGGEGASATAPSATASSATAPSDTAKGVPTSSRSVVAPGDREFGGAALTTPTLSFPPLTPLFVIESDDLTSAVNLARPPLPTPWDPTLDALLRGIVLAHGTTSWSVVAREMSRPPTSNTTHTPHPFHPIHLRDRWANIQSTSVKGPWSLAEDSLLKILVARFGAKKWSLSAGEFPGRAGKQCRERWLNHLDTAVNKSDWR